MADHFPTFRRCAAAVVTRRFWVGVCRLALATCAAVVVLGYASNIASLPTCRRLAHAEVFDAVRFGESSGVLRWLRRPAVATVSVAGVREGITRSPSISERLSLAPPLVLPSATPPAPWAFAVSRLWPVPFVVHIHYGFDGGPLWFEAGIIEYVVVFGHVISHRRVPQLIT